MARTIDNSDLEKLETPIQYLKGGGQERAQILERLGLRTAKDLLFFFPRDYKELVDACAIEDLRESVQATVSGTVDELDQRTMESGKSMFGLLLRQGNQYLRAVWFNQPFMRDRFRVGQEITLFGQPRFRGLRWEMMHPKIVEMNSGSSDYPGIQLPVYRLTEGVHQYAMRRLVRYTVENYASFIPEVFPREFLDDRTLLPIEQAITEIHRPSSPEQLNEARRRFVYQELLTMQIALAMRKTETDQQQRGPELTSSAKIDERIRRLFPYALTPDQNQAIKEIVSDMAGTVPMNRLLQGDVGTGKTVVAAYAILVAVANQHQAVLVAPTEALARQHFGTLASMLSESKVRLHYLSGSTSTAEKRVVLEGTASGDIDLVVSTQAVLGKQVKFARLGLMVIDEQHKFGVEQRANLRDGALAPHYLVMTATPIPRSIAMTLYGDLEVSVLSSGPPGRKPVKTYWADDEQRDQWWEFFRRKIREGRQGYVVLPVIDREADEMNGAEQMIGVEQALENLANGELSDFRLDVLHGRMNADDKNRAMDLFREGETQVLISTSLIEVGIDVPNANLMTIENANRFGLSQLHQLRGRVSRSAHPGFVCAFASNVTDTAKERLEAFSSTTNGFELAEIDFQLRGPGELFGTRQHGMPTLLMADLQRDQEILKQARADAKALISSDPELNDERFERLKKRVLAKYGKEMKLSNVG